MSVFRDAWNSVSLHASVPDPLLCRAWCQWAYNQFCDRRGWSHLKVRTILAVQDQKTGTCTVTRGSVTVTGGTLTFAATDVGRQFRLGTVPIYTIIAVSTVGATSATLDGAYAEATQTTTAYILDCYVTLPEDFHRFISVVDPTNRWRLRWWIDSSYLDTWDPARQSTGNPSLLANASLSPVVADLGKARFELYPYQTSARTFPVWYYRKSEDLTDDQQIIGPLSRRGVELLTAGALHRCALWPGTQTQKNPYFSGALAKTHRDEFEEILSEIDVVDEELYFEGLPLTQFGFADFPWNASWLQDHEPYTIG